MKLFTLILTLLFSFSLLAVKADLTPGDIAAFRKDKSVKRVIVLEGKAWPQITMMKVIPYTPKQNMDVFSNFENHKKFIPDLIKSKIIKKVNENETDVAFEMKMPWPISNSVYSSKNIIEQTGDDYKLTWSLIKSNQMKATDGNVIFESYGDKTLFTYTNHITPDSNFAGMFKGRVEDDVEKTYDIIVKYLNKTISAQVK